MKARHPVGGFTLIELMIAVAIIGILVALAYPSYRTYIERGRRAECRAGLLRALQQQERFFTQFNTYAAFNDGAANAPVLAFSGETLAQSACTIGARACAGSNLAACVDLTATANYGDRNIAKLYATSLGARQCELQGAAGRVTNRQHCWP